MRIDDENKIVWCSEELVDWKNSFNEAYDPLTNQLYFLARFEFGWGLVDYWQKDIPFRSWDHTKKNELMLALLNGYEFKIDQKEYYWRKKKKHLAWFEKQENCYLSKDFIEQIKLSNLDDEGAYKYFKFTEDFARDILKDDFNMFEKAECE